MEKKYRVVIVDDDKGGKRTPMDLPPMTHDFAMQIIRQSYPSGHKWLTAEPIN